MKKKLICMCLTMLVVIFGYTALGIIASAAAITSITSSAAGPEITGGPTCGGTVIDGDSLYYDANSSSSSSDSTGNLGIGSGALSIQTQIGVTNRATWLDSFMFVAGTMVLVIPLLLTGVYMGAKIGFPLAKFLIAFITKGKVNVQEIPLSRFLACSIPVMVLGVMLMNGQFKQLMSVIYSLLFRLAH